MELRQSAPNIAFAEPASPYGLALVASSTPPQFTVKELVAAAFPDAPVMVSIARAESQFVPDAKNASSTATGVFQILASTWTGAACEGTTTVASDNIACARKLYNDSGTTPWNASKGNW